MGTKGNVHWSNAKYEVTDPGHTVAVAKYKADPVLVSLQILRSCWQYSHVSAGTRWRAAVSKASAIFIYLGHLHDTWLFFAGETTITFLWSCNSHSWSDWGFHVPMLNFVFSPKSHSYFHKTSTFFNEHYWNNVMPQKYVHGTSFGEEIH